MRNTSQKIYLWATNKAASNNSTLWLVALFFLEIFLLIPLDAVLLFFCTQNPRKIFSYVLVAAIFSTISGSIGYLIGHLLWDSIGSYIVPSVIKTATFHQVSNHLAVYEHWAIFVGTLLPFPLKILSLASGVFKIGIFLFAGVMFSARLIRFLLIGIAALVWGEEVKSFLDKHFHNLLLVLLSKIALVSLVLWLIA
jgi:membrane protein YqaA with SNARE-associated domain